MDIAPDCVWDQSIADTIDRCSAMIAVVSRANVRSEITRQSARK